MPKEHRRPPTPYATMEVLDGLDLMRRAAEEATFTVDEQQKIDRAIGWLAHARDLRKNPKGTTTESGRTP